MISIAACFYLMCCLVHDRSIVGVELLVDRRMRQVYMLTIGHDCIKIWIACLVGKMPGEFLEIKKITHWLCGVQSYDVKVTGEGRSRTSNLTCSYTTHYYKLLDCLFSIDYRHRRGLHTPLSDNTLPT